MTTADRVPEPAPPMPQPGRPDRALVVLLGVIVALVVVALIVVFSTAEPARLDASTPAGAVQRYSAAVLDGDDEVAARYLSAAALTDCDAGEPAYGDDIRITLLDTDERGTTATVRVSIVTSSGAGPFGSSEYEFQDAFTLVRADGDWLVDQAPWQLTVCPTGTGDEPQ